MFESLQPISYAVVSIFFFISSITTLLRIYARGYLVRSFGLDDWCMFFILFFNAGQQIILYYFLHYGAGLHLTTVFTTHPEWLTNLTYALFAEEIYYIWMHWVIKMAFLLFYLRFATTRTFRCLVYGTMGLNTIFSIITWLLYVLQCMPLDAIFHPAAHPKAKCVDRAVLAFAPTGFSAFIDIAILILPIQPLWQIQVSVRKRLTLIGILSLGSLVVLVSMLRIIVLVQFEKNIDLTYTLGKLIIISSIEIDLAIIAANAPSLKIYWSKYISRPNTPTRKDQYESITLSTMEGKKVLSQASSCHISSSNKSGARSNMISPEIMAEEADIGIAISHERMLGELTRGSQEALWNSEDGIIVTSSVGVVVQDKPRQEAGDLEANYYVFDKE
ncbi:uncharacterized protein K444DRAFT_608218 [Hyaloscypha bicolor E]|uniref:Rhodopsin domain-containing protein n=1 Tax=Hyaloscypha bicolor E TaxID=1095630 RepID=A0A2J6TRJ4_9HELO|nr:uncharacterized protein K444DRAFT_608218 [Hyaloscypha bicolor E]PMD65643.1 hypothetical protein K444DRAFT_608218 [Hyaloscypha bicolor E]